MLGGTMTCPTCNKRQIARGRDVCQRCERLSVNGPKHEPACERCRDAGGSVHGCDIPGCKHWVACECALIPVDYPEAPR
jgi:hypothetical protein